MLVNIKGIRPVKNLAPEIPNGLSFGCLWCTGEWYVGNRRVKQSQAVVVVVILVLCLCVRVLIRWYRVFVVVDDGTGRASASSQQGRVSSRLSVPSTLRRRKLKLKIKFKQIKITQISIAPYGRNFRGARHVWTTCPGCYTRQCGDRESNPRPVDCKSSALTYRATLFIR